MQKFNFFINPSNFFGLLAQPDSPAELGNKIYEMMAMAVGGKWGRLEEGEEEEEEEKAQGDSTESDSSSTEGSDAQVIEPSEVRTENDPWND